MKKRENVGLILYKGNGKILLQQRTDGAPRNPGHWALFGGGIEEGESPVEALQRELLEELEYKIKLPAKLFYMQEYDQGDRHVTSYEFIEEFDASQHLVLHEGQGYAWFTPDEALALLITERRRKSFLKIKELLSV